MEEIIQHHIHHHFVTKKIFSFLMKHFSSRHYRRIIAITSLYFYLNSTDRLEFCALVKLNQIMHLAKRNNSLYMPFIVNREIWSESQLNNPLIKHEAQIALTTCINSNQALNIARKVVTGMPKWLVYGRRDDMVKDIAYLLMNGGHISRN